MSFLELIFFAGVYSSFTMLPKYQSPNQVHYGYINKIIASPVWICTYTRLHYVACVVFASMPVEPRGPVLIPAACICFCVFYTSQQTLREKVV